MRKLILLFVPCVAFAGGPKYSYPTPRGLDDEIKNIYHDIATKSSTATYNITVGVPGGTGTQIQYSNASSFGGVPGTSVSATGPIISSATITTLNVSFVKYPDGTVQVSSPTVGGGGSTVLQSSGIAFGSPTNTVASDTNTLNYTTTKELIVGTDTATNASFTSGILGHGLRLSADSSNIYPLVIESPSTIGSLNILRSYQGSLFLGDYFFINQNKSSVSFLTDSQLGTSPPQMSFQASAGANMFNMFATSATYHYAGGDSVVMNSGGITTNGVNDSALTASQFVKTDGSKNLISYDLLNATQTWTGTNTVSTMTYTAHTFSTLGSSAPNGTYFYCSDCTVTTAATCTANLLSSCVCAGSGNGAFAKRVNGTWYCN
jgi:hypothetical protein